MEKEEMGTERIIEKEGIENAYGLLKAVLQEALRIQTVLLTYPYEDLNKTDFGLRAMVWENYNDENSKISITEHTSVYRLLVVRSNLGFYNILIFLSKAVHPDFISVGPFRDEEISADYLRGFPQTRWAPKRKIFK